LPDARSSWSSLIASQGTLILFSPTMRDVGTPLGSFTVGSLSFSYYRLVLIATPLAVLLLLYFIFNKTRFGVLARATIQAPHMASALGVDTSSQSSVSSSRDGFPTSMSD
jgi:branched-chain amino acid transport system permease protein